MRAFVLINFYLWGLLGCTEAATSDTSPAPQPTESVSDDGSFEAVLAQHQALNTRLDSVTYQIRLANADLCPETTRSLGMTVHTVEDYPTNIRALARSTLSVSEDVSVRTVWSGSPAQKSGVRPRDKITRFGGYGLPTGATSKKLFRAISAQGLNATTVELSVLRGDELLDLQLRPETLCGYESRILWVDQINAFTDGETILITSELLRQTPEDNDLAMFVAHEMAHAITGHVDEKPSQALELEADRMGLILMARAGFDIEAAINNWPNMQHPHFEGAQRTSTHPSLDQRLENLKSTQKFIVDRQRLGAPLNFD